MVGCSGDIADRMAPRLARLFVRNKRHGLTGWDPASLVPFPRIYEPKNNLAVHTQIRPSSLLV